MNATEREKDWRRWLRYAREDLQVAEVAMTQLGAVPRISCVHAQQAAEKAIKAALVALDIDFPRRHGLNELRGLLPEGWLVALNPADLDSLSIWAIEARYPGDLPDATPEDASQAAELARRVVEEIVENLVEHGYPVEG